MQGHVFDTTDATLSALSVSGATLSPAFAAATTSYHAVVANSVTQGTLTVTTSETTATVEYLDNSDATLTDADTMTAGLQMNLRRRQQHRQGEGDRARHNDHEDLHRQRVSRGTVHRRVQRRRRWTNQDLDGKR